MKLTFKRKHALDRRLVRFWAEPILYEKFVEECKRHDLKMQHVFGDFMRWFIQSKDKVIEP